ncbi:MinD/ParA family ATP-binding protein [Pseudonocardia sp.]|uniref:MinD/ParA family ATP-binding protein n=1 Tax=Pseudonocardia sp. TaxID=60912 RepID=UPI003D0E4289
MARDPETDGWWDRYGHRLELRHASPADPPIAPAPQRPPSAPRPPASDILPELSEEAILRPRNELPTGGWRRALLTATGGLVNPGPGEAELARRELLHRVRRPLAGSHRIAVTSMKGGVGKTTVATCLGLVLAENRGDRAIVVDANPDAGTLADRLTGECTVTVRELLHDLDHVRSWADVSRYTSLAGRLQVLASEQDPASGAAFHRDEYERVIGVLARYFDLVVTDSGTGLVHSAMEGTLALADSVIVVGAPTVDGASRASKTLDWLAAHGHADLAAAAIVVLSCDRGSAEVDRERIRGHFAARCRAVVEVPQDPHLATGGRVELARLRGATLDAFLELAALVADRFGEGGGAPPGAVGPPAPAAPALGHAPA